MNPEKAIRRELRKKLGSRKNRREGTKSLKLAVKGKLCEKPRSRLAKLMQEHQKTIVNS